MKKAGHVINIIGALVVWLVCAVYIDYPRSTVAVMVGSFIAALSEFISWWIPFVFITLSLVVIAVAIYERAKERLNR